MSTWFRDYIFLPLEVRSREMQNAKVRISRNLMITMVLCGLWHGPSWNFVVWGGLHGAALAVYQLYATLRGPQVHRQSASVFQPGKLVARALTLSVVMLSYVFFGTKTLFAAWTYLWRLLTWSRDGVSLGSPYILPLVTLVFVTHLFVNKDRNIIEELPNYSVTVRACTYAALLLILCSLVASEAVPFVYVRF